MGSATRILGKASHPRARSISFVGLGRMGSEMAYNLFSKRFAEASDYHFAVCDAIPEAAARFADNFRIQFPGAHITVSTSPEE
jgi:3-hydroxyisobutyrate dehydrogenase